MSPNTVKIHTKNNLYQRIEVIKRNRQKRLEYNQFFVEGVQAITYAIENKWSIEVFAYTKERPLSLWAQQILASSQAASHVEMPLALMDELSDKEQDLSELIALVAMPANTLKQIPIHKQLVVTIIDRPASHGNLGTIIRSCEALRVDGLVILGHAVDLYDPKTVRASMGTIFQIPIIRLPSIDDLTAWFNVIRTTFPEFQVLGSTAKATSVFEDADLTGPLALLIGNETQGLSHKCKAICDQLLKIPMHGRITSLNVACAASILLYEIDRQRRKPK